MPKQNNFFISLFRLIAFFVAFGLFLVWIAKKLWGLRELWLKYVDPKVLESVKTGVPEDLWSSLPREVRKEVESVLEEHSLRKYQTKKYVPKITEDKRDGGRVHAVPKREVPAQRPVAKPISKPVVTPVSKPAGINERQAKVLNIVGSYTNGVEMGKVAGQIKSVSDRTLRRDMAKLEEMGLIKRAGTTRDSLYYRA